jgi:pyrroline-5-carboxylate reductase
MSQPRTERANRLSPILAVTALLGSAAAFVYVVVAALAPLG